MRGIGTTNSTPVAAVMTLPRRQAGRRVIKKELEVQERNSFIFMAAAYVRELREENQKK